MELFEKIKRKSDLMRKKAQDAARSEDDDAFAPLKHPADKGEPGFLGKLVKFVIILTSGTYKAIIGTANLARKVAFLAIVFFALSMAWKYMGWKNEDVGVPKVNPVRTESPAKTEGSFLDSLKSSIGIANNPSGVGQDAQSTVTTTGENAIDVTAVESVDERRARESKQGEKYVQLPVLYPIHAQKALPAGQIATRLEMRDVAELEKIRVDVKDTKSSAEERPADSKPRQQNENSNTFVTVTIILVLGGVFVLRKRIGNIIRNIMSRS